MRISLPSLLLLSSLASPALAAPPPHADAVDSVLLSAPSPETLRARLLALARRTPSKRVASQALLMRGTSFARAGMADSAIVCYRRAGLGVRNPAATNALVEALLLRHEPADLDEVIQMLSAVQADEQDPGLAVRADPARLGWAHVLKGSGKRGFELMEPVEHGLVEDPVWQYRYARAYLAVGKPEKALPYLLNLNTDSRGSDNEIISRLNTVEQFLPGANLRDEARAAIQERDDSEAELLRRVHGRRVFMDASDKTRVGAVLAADSTVRRAPAAVVLANLGDLFTDYDSLMTALRGSGYSVLYLDPRGSGWSVSPQVPLPDTWTGRQDALSKRVVRDIGDAIRTFGQSLSIDTAHVVLAGVGSMAPIAAAAAAADPHVSALALLDPWTSPVERGATLGAVRRAAVPTFIHIGLKGRGETVFADTLIGVAPARGSRLLETQALKPGGAAFGSSPELTPAFIRWLGGAKATTRTRGATPPPKPPSR